MSKLRVLVAPLCGSQAGQWIHPLLAKNLVEMAKDERFDVSIELIMDKTPVSCARNYAVTLARKSNCDYAFMIDHDESFEFNPLDVLNEGLGKDVIIIPTVQSVSHESFARGDEPIFPNFRTLPQSQRETDGNFFTIELGGTGAIFIRRILWSQLKGPWFKTVLDSSEIGDVAEGEDFNFSRVVRESGFKVWCYSRMAMHYKTSELARLGGFFEIAKQMGDAAAKAGIPTPTSVAWNVQAKGGAAAKE